MKQTETREDAVHRVREREIERQAKHPSPAPQAFGAPLVGVSFHPEYPHNLWRLQRYIWTNGSLIAQFVRDPENEYDSNAVRVQVGDELIGHLTRPLALRLAPALDAGVRYDVRVTKVTGNIDNLDSPGCEIYARVATS